MDRPPTDAHPSLQPFEPAAERSLTVYGARAELALLPARKNRAGQVGAGRPALRPSPAGRILDEESIWRGADLAATPNRYPFARDQRILWMARPAREPDRSFWLAAHQWLVAADGVVLLNNIGAAATIARAHAHLIPERLPFLSQLPERPLASPPIDVPDGCELVHKDVPFCLVGVRGDLAGRVDALLRLADARLTATWNVVADSDATWIAPRAVETPAPHFSAPLGSSEFWGRWCFVDEQAFEEATQADLERALQLATAPAIE